MENNVSPWVERGELCRMLGISYSTLALRLRFKEIEDGKIFGAKKIKRWSREYVLSLLDGN